MAALFCFRVILKEYVATYPDDCEPAAWNTNSSFRIIWKIWDERIFDAVPMDSRVSVEMHCIRCELQFSKQHIFPFLRALKCRFRI